MADWNLDRRRLAEIRAQDAPLNVDERFLLDLVDRLIGTQSNVRWTAQKKVALLAAIDHQLITDAEAEWRFALSAEELRAWREKISSGGELALQVKSIPRRRRLNV